MSTSPTPALLREVPETFLTPRLQLRPHRPEDAPALQEALAESSAHLRQFLWGLPWVAAEPTRETALARCRRSAAQFLLREDLAWLAFEREGGRLVGSVGLHRSDWSLPRTEVGYWMRPSVAGRGLAVEAVDAVVGWALDGLGALRVDLVADAANTASRRVAERCGFTLEGIQRQVARAPDGSLRDHCLYARLGWPAPG